jgi:hypothetical protein
MAESKPFTHRYPLRRDFEVEVSLPEDLTMKEVERMSRWLSSIPFDQRQRLTRTRGGGTPKGPTGLHDFAFGSLGLDSMLTEVIDSALGPEGAELKDKWLREVANNEHLKELILELHDVLFDLADTDACNLDGSGSCQAHNWFGGNECPHPRAKLALAKAVVVIGKRPRQ